MISNKTVKRHNTILELLSSGKTISVEEFCKVLCCSPSTIRNDLKYLAEQKKLSRTFGGAHRLEPNPAEGVVSSDISASSELPSEEIVSQSCHEIACYAVDHLVTPHSTIILESSNVSCEIARLIASRRIPVSVLTFSLKVINILADIPSVNLYCFGGYFNRPRLCFFHDYIAEQTKMLHADIYFMQVIGVSPEAGFTISCQDIPVTERALMGIATKTVALCESANLGRSTYRIIAGFDSIGSLITDSQADEDYVNKLREEGLNVMMP